MLQWQFFLWSNSSLQLLKTRDQLFVFIVRNFALNQERGWSRIKNRVVLSTGLFICVIILFQTSYQPRFCSDRFQMFKMVVYQQILASNGSLVNTFLEVITGEVKRFPNEMALFNKSFIKFVIVEKHRFLFLLLDLFWKTQVRFGSLNELLFKALYVLQRLLLNDLQVFHAGYIVLWFIWVTSDALWALETICIPLESLSLNDLVLLNQNLVIDALRQPNMLLNLIQSHLHLLVVHLLPLFTLGSL